MLDKLRPKRAVGFTVQCLDADSCEVHFEPRGGYIPLGREELITIEISGGRGPRVPEIAYLPGTVMVCSWPWARFRVWNSDGKPIEIVDLPARLQHVVEVSAER